MQTLDVVLCLPTLVAYKAEFPPKPDDKSQSQVGIWQLQQAAAPSRVTAWYRHRAVVVAIALLIGTSIVLSAAFGFQIPLVFLPMTWIIPVVSSFHFPQMSIRRVSQLMIAYIVRFLFATPCGSTG